MSEINSIEFRPIDGYPGYRVGSDGSVWSAWTHGRGGSFITDTWRLKKQILQKDRTAARSYLRLGLNRDGKTKTFKVHSLILTAFVGPRPEGMECRHLDGVPTHNWPSNLAWGTPEQNRDDSRKHGSYTHGKRFYTHDGKSLVLKEWAAFLKVPYACLWSRVNRLGMSFEQAISKPFLGRWQNTNAKRTNR